jgi:valyl-tRNA synthetase
MGHFESLLKLLHPLMPFITEEMWHLLAERKSPEDSLVVASWPKAKEYDKDYLKGFERATELTTQVRNIRKKNNIANKVALELYARDDQDKDAAFYPLVQKLANIENIHRNTEIPGQAFTFVLGQAEYGVPFGDEVDAGEQADKMKEELGYTRGFLKSVQKKLANERFVNNAPDKVVANEKQKEADARAKISLLEEKLNGMGVQF